MTPRPGDPGRGLVGAPPRLRPHLLYPSLPSPPPLHKGPAVLPRVDLVSGGPCAWAGVVAALPPTWDSSRGAPGRGSLWLKDSGGGHDLLVWGHQAPTVAGGAGRGLHHPLMPHLFPGCFLREREKAGGGMEVGRTGRRE